MDDVRPDRSFMRQLHLLDKRLGVKFNGTHFVITCTTERFGEVNIWKVADERGGFRQPDQRELDILQESNIERLSPDDKFSLVQAHMAKVRSDDRARAKDDIRNRTKDDKIQLVQAFSRAHGAGKGNAAFRRIIQP